MKEDRKEKFLRKALEVEQEGINTYSSLAEDSAKPPVVKFFEYMLEQEKSHKKSLEIVLRALHDVDRERIKKISRNLEKEDISTPVFPDNIEVGSKTNITELLNRALEFEENGMEFYSSIGSRVQDDELERFFDDLKSQEKKHREMIVEFGREEFGVLF